MIAVILMIYRNDLITDPAGNFMGIASFFKFFPECSTIFPRLAVYIRGLMGQRQADAFCLISDLFTFFYRPSGNCRRQFFLGFSTYKHTNMATGERNFRFVLCA